MNTHEQPRRRLRRCRRSGAQGTTRRSGFRRRPTPSARSRDCASGLDLAKTAICPANRTFDEEPNDESKK